MTNDEVDTINLMSARGAEIAKLAAQIARLAERQASDAARLLRTEVERMRGDRDAT